MRQRRYALSMRARLTVWYTGVLLVILLVISGLSYSVLRLSLLRDVDDSLTSVAEVVLDAGYAGAGQTPPNAEETVRAILGPDVYDTFFRLVAPDGTPRAEWTHLRPSILPLSSRARSNALDGVRTFETMRLASGERVRLLTLPVMRDGALAELVQVGMSLRRAEQTSWRFLRTLLILVPLGVVLAAGGGLLMARAILGRIDALSRTARRISAEDLRHRLAVRGTGDELDHLTDTLNDMLARLEHAFAEVRRFSADAAHELRTPLTALKGGIEVALRTPRSAEEYRVALLSAQEDVEHIIRLAEDLLLVSRSSMGTAPPPAPIDFEPVVLEVYDAGLALGRAAEVTVALTTSVPVRVVGDSSALERMLRNLVDNAVKYTPPGGKVEIALTVEGREAVVTVRDTGIGIAAEDLARIFEPFVRLETARGRLAGGTGLGLAIARSIVEAHHGTITAESPPGAGTTFAVRLPLA